jgi:hypothetical protein
VSDLAALYGGSAPHRRTLLESEYARYFDEVVHVLDIHDSDLKAFDGLFIPSRLHIEARNAHHDRLREFLEDGGNVVTFGQQPGGGSTRMGIVAFDSPDKITLSSTTYRPPIASGTFTDRSTLLRGQMC